MSGAFLGPVKWTLRERRMIDDVEQGITFRERFCHQLGREGSGGTLIGGFREGRWIEREFGLVLGR